MSITHRKGFRRQSQITNPSLRIPQSTLLLQADVIGGLEDVAASEISSKLSVALPLIQKAPGTVRWEYVGDLADTLALRSIQSAYIVKSFDIPRPKALLGQQHFDGIIAIGRTILALHPPNAFTSLHVSAAGSDSAVMVRLRSLLAERLGLKVGVTEGDLVFRIRRSTNSEGDAWEILARISPRPLSTRAWRVCNMRGALDAGVAHAMAVMSNPTAADRILNIACGSGTLMIERLAIAHAELVVGCDLDSNALDCAGSNLNEFGQRVRVDLLQSDAVRLPLANSLFNVIFADLPFGKLVGSHRINEILYPRLMDEAARVAMTGSRMLLITHDIRLMESTLSDRMRLWRVESVLRVQAGAMSPRIFVLRRC